MKSDPAVQIRFREIALLTALLFVLGALCCAAVFLVGGLGRDHSPGIAAALPPPGALPAQANMAGLSFDAGRLGLPLLVALTLILFIFCCCAGFYLRLKSALRAGGTGQAPSEDQSYR